MLATIELVLRAAYARLELDAVGEPTFVPIPVLEADRVDVEVAWSHDPFEASGCSEELAAALIAIQDGVATANAVPPL